MGTHQNKQLRVYHIPQVGYNAIFYQEVPNEEVAFYVVKALEQQHLFLLENNIINDYSNIIGIEMFKEEEKEWVDYCDEKGRDWGDVEEEMMKTLK